MRDLNSPSGVDLDLPSLPGYLLGAQRAVRLPVVGVHSGDRLRHWPKRGWAVREMKRLPAKTWSEAFKSEMAGPSDRPYARGNSVGVSLHDSKGKFKERTGMARRWEGSSAVMESRRGAVGMSDYGGARSSPSLVGSSQSAQPNATGEDVKTGGKSGGLVSGHASGMTRVA
jgi:hypothetical protein